MNLDEAGFLHSSLTEIGEGIDKRKTQKRKKRSIQATDGMSRQEELTEYSTSPYPEVIHDLPVPALLLDFEGGRIQDVNDRCLSLIGYERDKLIDRVITDLDIVTHTKSRMVVEELVRDQQEYRNQGMQLNGPNGDIRHVISSAGIVTCREDSYLLLLFTELTAQKYLQRVAVEAFARQHRQMGEHLQEELIQTLTGLRLLGQALAEELEGDSSRPERLVTDFNVYLDEAAMLTRKVRDELLPVEVDEEGLSAALKRLSNEAEEMHGICCEFICDRGIRMSDHTAAMTCYYVVQQTVRYQARIGSEGPLEIKLIPHAGLLQVVVADKDTSVDGDAIKGLKRILRLMRYALGLFGGELEVEKGTDARVRVVCQVPGGR